MKHFVLKNTNHNVQFLSPSFNVRVIYRKFNVNHQLYISYFTNNNLRYTPKNYFNNIINI